MTSMRREEDLLGEREIENDKYYGVHTLRAMENFEISHSKISDYPLFVDSLVLTKEACAKANKELKTFEAKTADMIIKACQVIHSDLNSYVEHFPIDVFQGGAGTSVNMNTNEVIANVALELHDYKRGEYEVINPNDHVNKSQSTNDSYPTSFRVALIRYLNDLVMHIDDLAKSFKDKGDEFKDILKMGRTQLQDAVPMSLGEEFAAFGDNLLEELDTINMAKEKLYEINLGSTAIGTGVNAPEGFSELSIKHLATMTQIPFKKATNLIEATSDTGAYVLLSGVLKRFAVKLSKVCNDLRLLSSGPRCGLNEINLPQRQAGSSIMPAKVNPVIPEVVNQVCFKVIGNDTTVAFASEAGQLQLNVMEPVIAQALFESISLLSNACDSLKDNCVVGITANKEICYNSVINSIGIITYLNPIIGHHNGDLIGKKAAQTGKSIRELILEEKLLSEEELNKLLSVDNLLRPQYSGKRF